MYCALARSFTRSLSVGRGNLNLPVAAISLLVVNTIAAGNLLLDVVVYGLINSIFARVSRVRSCHYFKSYSRHSRDFAGHNGLIVGRRARAT